MTPPRFVSAVAVGVATVTCVLTMSTSAAAAADEDPPTPPPAAAQEEPAEVKAEVVEEAAPPPPPPPPAPSPAPVPLAEEPPAKPSIAFQVEPTAPTGQPLAANTDRPQASSKEKPGSPEHFRIGPMVGIGFPRPLEIEAFAKIEKVIGVGLEYSFMPKMTIMGAETSFRAITADFRVFPFKGAFFIGARAGRQWLDARTTITVNQVASFNEQMDASTWFINPRIGFLKTWDSGITLGIDAGVQIPINPTYERSGALTDSGLSSQTNIDQTLTKVAGALGNNVTPTIDLLRVGFLF